MSYRKKFHIAGLGGKTRFAGTLKPVMAHHIARTQARIASYLQNPESENLHNLRIALRRFRYILELYCDTIKPKPFKKVYELAVHLQNVLGERRDIDVMHEKLLTICRNANTEIPAYISEQLAASRQRLESEIVNSLNEFLRHKQIKKLADR